MANEEIDPRLLAQKWYMQQLAQDNLIKYQLDSTFELDRLRLDLLGMEINDNGEEVLSAEKKQKMNKRGVADLMAFLRPRITRIVSLSNLDENEVRNRCLRFMDTLTFLLARHMHDYDIQSLQILDNIIELCDDICFTTMMKAYEAGERDTIRKQFTHVESREKITQQTPPQRPFMNPFGVK